MKKNPEGKEVVDQSAMAWRGFWTALLGYIAAHLTTLPTSGSQSEVAALREQVAALDRRVSNFIDGFATYAPGAKRR